MQRVRKLGDSQVTLSPKFKLASIRSERCFMGDPLIPGLPDDIALICLLRLPLQSQPAYRAVCKRWYQLFSDKGKFFTRRKELGIQNPWLFVCCFRKLTGRIEWHVLDLTHFSWHKIPAMPCSEKACPIGFRSVSVPGDGSLIVAGDADCPPVKFDVQKNQWTAMRQMNTPRSCFAGGVIDGVVYVAGGNAGDRFELDSGEAMDPSTGTWRPIANMGANIAAYDAAVLAGKLLVTEGWFWPFHVVPRGRVYDPQTNNWGCMSTGLREGWTGSSAVIYGRLFVVSEHERMKLKVYDAKRDNWDIVEGLALPEQICKPFAVNCCDNRIYVAGRKLHVAVGHILLLNETENLRFSVKWQVVEAPKYFYDLAPIGSQVIFA